jgi:hypothetical protein
VKGNSKYRPFHIAPPVRLPAKIAPRFNLNHAPEIAMPMKPAVARRSGAPSFHHCNCPTVAMHFALPRGWMAQFLEAIIGIVTAKRSVEQ